MISQYNTEYFAQLNTQLSEIHSELSSLSTFHKERQQKFATAMKSFQKYVKKQSQMMDANQRACRSRDEWYRQQINKCWKNGISNRQLILRTLARTNVLKRDADEWLARIEDEAFQGPRRSRSNSNLQNQSMQGSMLIDKYNQILGQYQNRI